MRKSPTRKAARAIAPPLDDTESPLPPRVEAAGEAANRDERKRLLSAILRDGGATGAEAVAAARLLEAMERTDNGADARGLPPPTNLPEQIARMTRLLTAAGPKVVLPALEIVANRVETSRANAYVNRARGVNPMDFNAYKKIRSRILGPKAPPLPEETGHERDDRDSEHGAASDDGMPEQTAQENPGFGQNEEISEEIFPEQSRAESSPVEKVAEE